MGLLPAGERYWRGSPPRAPTWGKGLYARLCLALRPCGNYIWGFAPCPDSRTFLGKSPRDPKKPNRIRYNLSNGDSEQGCRRQPCFFARRRQHVTATAPTPRAPAVPPAPAARRAAPHSPVVHPTLTVVPSVIAPSPCTSRASQSPHRSSETADFQFFTKHFKL